jgi:hypothetical protein
MLTPTEVAQSEAALFRPATDSSRQSVPIASRPRSLTRDLDVSSEAEALQKHLAIFPRQPKRPHVGKPESTNDINKLIGIRWVEIGFLQGILSPINELLEGEFVTKPPHKFAPHYLSRDHHWRFLR